MFINLIELFERGALKKCPNKIAMIEGERSVTFKDIERNAKIIASALVCGDAGLNNCVAVVMKNGINILVADLAVLYSGKYYTNLDVKSPVNRLRYIVENLAPALFITDGEYLEIVRGFCADDKKIINIDNVYDVHPLPDSDLFKRINKIIDTDPACVINTSGSTGIPKSGVLNHRGLLDYAFWSFNAMKLSGDEVSGVIPAFYFDGYLTAFFNCIYNGATFVIAPDNILSFPIKLAEYFAKYEIRFIFWVPSVLVMFVTADVLSKIDLSSLKTICFAGEVFNTRHYHYWKSHIPGAKYINLYGPIEISVICTYYVINREFKENEPIPIGEACRNTNIILLKDDDTQAGPQETGEICVRGSSLAMGYFNNPEKTAASFTRNPLNPYYPELIYRTGDLAYYNEYGELMFVGRKDFQIKHMGYRLELGEIEHLASSIPGVKHVCILYYKENKTITMFYEADEDIPPSVIRADLGKTLPKYALPTAFCRMDELPRNPNGKIDRQKLTEIMLEN